MRPKSAIEAERRYGKKLLAVLREARLARWKAGAAVRIPTTYSKQLIAIGKKWCPHCKKIKSFSKFSQSRNPHHSGGLAPHCKMCCRLLTPPYSPRRYKKSRGKMRDAHLRKRFGITLADYQAMLTKQKGVCAICGRKDRGKALAVDHDHVTNRVRGLLCTRCNPAIGFLEESPERARSIIRYLKRHGK